MTGLSKIFLTLGIFCFLLANGLGAPPTKGRYMWLKCNPNGKDANCVKQKGPMVNIAGLPDKLPASAVRDMSVQNAVLVRGAPVVNMQQTEGSAEGSGFAPMPVFKKIKREAMLPEVRDVLEEEHLLV